MGKTAPLTLRIRSCRLTAEIRGGRWNRAPVKVSRARATSASPPGTLPCSLATQTYSLPAPCWDLTRRVARSTQTIRHPVTLGCLGQHNAKRMEQTGKRTSKVPEWPVFSTLILLARRRKRRKKEEEKKEEKREETKRDKKRHAPKNPLDPCHHFVARRVRRLVQVDHTRADVGLEVAAQRRAAVGNGREVAGTDQH